MFSITNDLNWNVISTDLVAVGPMGQLIPTGRVAQVREDNLTYLGQTSKNYRVFQNENLKNLINPLVEEGLLDIKNIGYLGNGEKVFIQAQMTSDYIVAGETHQGMITLLNSHDGSTALSGGVTATRVICGNTFAMAQSDLSTRIRHNAQMHDKAMQITDILDYVNDGMRIYTEAAERLAVRGCNMTELERVVEHAFNKPEGGRPQGYNKIVRLFRTGAGNNGSTMFDAFNAVTDFVTHESNKSAAKRFDSANFGNGAKVSRRAMDMCLTLA